MFFSLIVQETFASENFLFFLSFSAREKTENEEKEIFILPFVKDFKAKCKSPHDFPVQFPQGNLCGLLENLYWMAKCVERTSILLGAAMY